MGLLQLLRGYIDADRNAETARRPGFHLQEHILDDPFVDFESHRMPFDGGQKCAGSEEAPFRMLPADQSLSADDRAGGHVHLWLVIEEEFVASESGADARQVFVMTARGTREA